MWIYVIWPYSFTTVAIIISNFSQYDFINHPFKFFKIIKVYSWESRGFVWKNIFGACNIMYKNNIIANLYIHK